MKHKKSGEIDIYYCSTYLKDAKKVIPYNNIYIYVYCYILLLSSMKIKFRRACFNKW